MKITVFWFKCQWNTFPRVQLIIHQRCLVQIMACHHPYFSFFFSTITTNTGVVSFFYLRPVLAFRFCHCLHLSVCVSIRLCAGNNTKVRHPNLPDKMFPKLKKNCQIYPTKYWTNAIYQIFLSPIISYCSTAWIRQPKPCFLMGKNGGCWRSRHIWS